ncbi:uncharacterized protein LOC115634245 isoform X2 [Scaptodrosophila lebanonensis]|nr:uncharacterized protein LOC115634245 isoform X2 [Scaptodrosophila lebanonensis]
MPLVATLNDTVPDVKAMWTNPSIDRDNYLCNMTPGFSCVKYSYVFRGGIQNITYMCARVNNTNGCYRQTHESGMQVEACVCNSKLGLMPCNSAANVQLDTFYHNLGLAVCLLNTLLLLNKYNII